MTDTEKIEALCAALEPFAAATGQMTPVGASVKSCLVVSFEYVGSKETISFGSYTFSISREAVQKAADVLEAIKKETTP